MTGAGRVCVAGLLGMVVGVAITTSGWWLLNRRTRVMTTTSEVRLEGGIVLPKGTDLTFDTSMSEGFEVLKLYVNVNHPAFDRLFQARSEPHGFFIHPYWVSE
jgi:hypothetical protein